jgi:hypothetical protein
MSGDPLFAFGEKGGDPPCNLGSGNYSLEVNSSSVLFLHCEPRMVFMLLNGWGTDVANQDLS